MSLQFLNLFVIHTRHDLVNSSVRRWVQVVKNSDRVCRFQVLEKKTKNHLRCLAIGNLMIGNSHLWITTWYFVQCSLLCSLNASYCLETKIVLLYKCLEILALLHFAWYKV